MMILKLKLFLLYLILISCGPNLEGDSVQDDVSLKFSAGRVLNDIKTGKLSQVYNLVSSNNGNLQKNEFMETLKNTSEYLKNFEIVDTAEWNITSTPGRDSKSTFTTVSIFFKITEKCRKENLESIELELLYNHSTGFSYPVNIFLFVTRGLE